MSTIYHNCRQLFFLCLLSTAFNAAGANEKFNSRVNSPLLTNGTTLSVFDDKYSYMLANPSAWPNEFAHKTITNRVILSVNQEAAAFQAVDYTVDMNVMITYYVWSGGTFVAQLPVFRQLSLQYQLATSYDDKAIFEFAGGNAMTVQVLSMSVTSASANPTLNLSLEAEIDVERYYAFNPSFSLNGPQLGHDAQYVPTRGELEIYWDFIPGAEEYDLEWLHINNYDAAGNHLLANQIKLDDREFQFNSTRISTSNTAFRIPLVYEHGFIVYRVRGIGYSAATNFDRRVEGAWSGPSNCTGINAKVACYAPHFYENSGHEEGLNWQYSASFAEEGKLKVVANYFDGTQRNRQVVSQLNSEDKTIVGETFFDHQGRGAIQALPVPSLNPKLGFQPEFNLNTALLPYNRNNFDLDQNPGACFAITDPMDPTLRGASYYYSGSNTDNKAQQAYLPDAKKYPFTQVEYTPDNTGRIRRQGGVGADHQLNSNRETKYFYGVPFQEELDRLFGSEVGDGKHYKKNMVIDPNEQISVSYLDMSGKVIATGLTGVAPQNLLPLGNTTTPMTIDLLNKAFPADKGSKNTLDPVAGTLSMDYEILVDSKAERDFFYEMKGASFLENCQVQLTLPDNSTVTVSDQICYNCIFDLEYSLTDECGLEYISGVGGSGNTKTVVGSALLNTLRNTNFLPNTFCGQLAPSFNSSLSSDVALQPWKTNNGAAPVQLPVGNYSLHKKLKVNREALDLYADNYIKNNKCLLDLDYFKKWSIANIDFSGCNISCAECAQKLGEFDLYDVDVTPSCDPCLTRPEYDDLLARCFENCKDSSIVCASALVALKADMSPNGQYGEIRPGNTVVNGVIISPSGNINPAAFPLSVFNETNVLPRKSNFPNSSSFGSGQVAPNWRHPYDPTRASSSPQAYREENGQLSYVQLSFDGSTNYVPAVVPSKLGMVINSGGGNFKVAPQYLANVEDFLDAWEPSWADALVFYHPEYCYYEFCLGIEPSHQFDDEWMAVTKVADFAQLPTSTPANPMASDPYFSIIAPIGDLQAPGLSAAMSYYMANYISDGSTTYSMLEMAYKTALCPSFGTPGCNTACNMPTGYNFTELGVDNDAVWNTFKSMYISLKQKYQERHRTKYAIKKTCYNGCIGEDQFNPFLNRFYSTPYSTISGSFWTSFPWSFSHWNSQYFNFAQPCNWARWYYYHEKSPRFPTTSQMLGTSSMQSDLCYDQQSNGEYAAVDCPAQSQAILDEAQNLANLANYGKCRQCPLARDFEALLNTLVQHQELQQSAVGLSCYPAGYGAFSSTMADALTNNVPPMTGPFTWNYLPGSSVPFNLFSASINGATGSCGVSLKFPTGNTLYDFSDITRICRLEPLATPVLFPPDPGKNFTVTVIVKILPGDPGYQADFPDHTKEIQLEGITSCLNIADCVFDPICAPSADAIALQNLFNALLYGDGTSSLFSASNIGLTTFPYNALTNPLVDAFDAAIDPGNVNPTAGWRWSATNSGTSLTASISAPGQSGNCSITFTLPTASGYNIVDIQSFSGIKPKASGGGFTATALVTNGGGSAYVQVDGSSPCFDFGKCSTELPSNMVMGQGTSTLMNSGLENCPPTREALAFVSFLNGIPASVLFAGGNTILYEDCPITLNLPVSVGFPLTDLSNFYGIAPDVDHLNAADEAYQFVLYATTSTGVVVQLSGISTCLLIGKCDCENIAHLDEDAVFPLHRGVAAATNWTGTTAGFVFGIVDIRDPQSNGALHAQNWAAPMYHHPDWTRAKMGDVFGIAFDREYHPNVYLSSAAVYSSLSMGTGGAGAVYKIDGNTGAVSTFAQLPNSGSSQLGNLCYDQEHQQFFVSNFEDGRIYRLDPQGNILNYFDPFNPDNGTAGFAPLGERLWGVAYYNGRVYFSVWNTDCGRQTNQPYLHQEIHSVKLDASGNFTGTSALEISVPFLGDAKYSNPVSDISFSSTGNMLLGERTMMGDAQPNAHRSRILEYAFNGTAWAPTAANYSLNQLNLSSGCGQSFKGSNCAGGVSYTPTGVVGTGDGLLFSPDVVYGLSVIPQGGNTFITANAANYYIDLDGFVNNSNKTQIGDVEVFFGTPCDTCISPELVLNGEFSGGNTGFTSGFSFVNGCVDEVWPLNYEYTLATDYNSICPDPVLNPSVKDHTSGTGPYMLFCDGYNTSNTPLSVWKQQNIAVLPGKTYKFSAWVNYIQVQSDINQLAFTVNGAPVATKAEPYFSTNHNWQYVQGTWNSGGATVANLEISSIANLRPTIIGLDDISFKSECTPVQEESAVMCCLPHMGTIIQPDSCITDLLNIAKHNAEEMYAAYIKEVREKFEEAYIAQCLQVYEASTMAYVDAEHHFTLYYYDEAGNLVRTIPPAGVRKVTDNPNPVQVAADMAQIKLDRANKTHTFFTKHTYATTYKYNSLNQLVAQTVPDHEDLEIWRDAAANNGIPANHTVHGSRFSDLYKGIAYSEDNTSNGHLYTTANGGALWTEVSTIGIENLRAVQLVTGTAFAYAVGANGTLVQSTDQGNSWVVQPVPTTGNLVGLYFNTFSNGIVVEENGRIWQTATGGNTWVSAPILSLYNLVQPARISAVEASPDNPNIVTAVADDGRIFRSNNNGIIWTAQTAIRTTGLTAVQQGPAGSWWAIGADGTLLKSSNSDNWAEIPNNLHIPLLDFHFRTDEKGCAIDFNGNLYKTLDFGKTWTAVVQTSLSNLPIQPIKALSFLDAINGYAVSSSGLVYISANGGLSWNVLSNGPGATGIQTLDFSDANTGVVAGAAGQVYQTTNAGASWAAISGLPLTMMVLDIHLQSAGKAVAILTDGTNNFLYRLNTGVWTLITPPVADTYRKLHFTSPSNGSVIGKNGNVLSTFNGGGAWTAISAGAAPVGGYRAVSYSAGTLVAVGDNGQISRSVGGGAWQDKTYKIQTPALSGIGYAPGNHIWLCGQDGTVLRSDNNGNDWYTQESHTSTDVRDVAFQDPSRGIAVMAAGLALETLDGGTTWSASAATGLSDNLNAVVYSAPASAYFAAGDNCSMLRINAPGGSWSPQNACIGATKLLGLAANASVAEVLSVGDLGKIFKRNTGGAWSERKVKPPVLNDLYMLDPLTGIGVGKKGIVLNTADGGASWQYRRASTVSEDLNSVVFNNAAQGLVVGNKGTVLHSLNGGASWTAQAIAPEDLNDVSIIKQTGKCVVVGNIGKVFAAPGVGSPWAAVTVPTTDNLEAVYFTDNTWGYAVGANGTMLQISNNATNWTAVDDAGTDWVSSAYVADGQTPPGNKGLTDVYFLDYTTGYAIGREGTMLKTITGGNTWELKNIGVQNTNDLLDMAFADPNHIYVSGASTGGANLALIYDFTDQFSSLFYYDVLGRLVVSQNSWHFAKSKYTYSYTLYDDLGRIIEVGELTATHAMEDNYVGRKLDNTLFQNWVNSGNKTNPTVVPGIRKEVTRTYYDQPLVSFLPISQENLRNRVASITYEAEDDNNPLTYDNATHYKYDIHGNVSSLLQDVPELLFFNQQYKRVDYVYDLISGNVLEVRYQPGESDQFSHFYEYDADNRIINVRTSDKTGIRDQDAKYYYYQHGSLARVEIGELKVQAVDYAYTIQGWIKGVNSDRLDKTRDMGKDGVDDGVHYLHKNIAKDEYGFTLGYYSGDYSAINSPPTDLFELNTTGSTLEANSPNLYNGNISHMVTTIRSFMKGGAAPQGMSYQYDQLNRLASVRKYDQLDPNPANNAWSATAPASADYAEDFTYDANGNILTLKRTGIDPGSGSNAMDNLAYQYENIPSGYVKNTNKLKAVLDSGDNPDNTAFDDIKAGHQHNPAQPADDNYQYDEIGNLIQDKSEYLESITWTVYGKVHEVIKDKSHKTSPYDLNNNGQLDDEIVLEDLEFRYDAMGNRIFKIVKPHRSNADGLGLSDQSHWKYTYYARDAQGNTLAVYDLTYAPGNAPQEYLGAFKWAEAHLYGSSRIGIKNEDRPIAQVRFSANIGSDGKFTQFSNQTAIIVGGIAPPLKVDVQYHNIGKKQFELSNHLGNVLTTVSDRRNAVDAEYKWVGPGQGDHNLENGGYVPVGAGLGDYSLLMPADGQVSEYLGDVLSAGDYYAFGMGMVGRMVSGGGYRYGFGNKEEDNEIKGDRNSVDFGARIYDPRVGRWLSLDPLMIRYPSLSPYCFAANMPTIATDPDGKAIVINTTTTSYNGKTPAKAGDIGFTNPTYSFTFNTVTNEWDLQVNIHITYTSAFNTAGANKKTLEQENPGLLQATQIHEGVHEDRSIKAAKSPISYTTHLLSGGAKTFTGTADKVMTEIYNEYTIQRNAERSNLINTQAAAIESKYNSLILEANGDVGKIAELNTLAQAEFDTWANKELITFDKKTADNIKLLATKILDKVNVKSASLNVHQGTSGVNSEASKKMPAGSNAQKYQDGKLNVTWQGKTIKN
jgi:RHS repeat-associated protein